MKTTKKPRIKKLTKEDFLNKGKDSTEYNFYVMAMNDFFAFRVLYNHYKQGDISAKGLLNMPLITELPKIVKKNSTGDIMLSDIAAAELLRFTACQELLTKHASPYLSLAVKFDDEYAKKYLSLGDKNPDDDPEFKEMFDNAWIKINSILSADAMSDIVENDENLKKEYEKAYRKKQRD